MMALRTRDGLVDWMFRAHSGGSSISSVLEARVIQQLAHDGFLEPSDDYDRAVRATPRGLQVLDQVIVRLCQSFRKAPPTSQSN